MITRDILLFLIIQIAFVFYAHAEAYMEGKRGWRWNKAWWRFRLPGGYWYTAYHMYMYIGTFPLLIFGIPLVLLGWDWHLMLVLAFSYCIGNNLADFLWFVVNPLYPLRKWNPRQTRWYPWTSFGKWHIPRAYLIRFVISAILLPLIVAQWSNA